MASTTRSAAAKAAVPQQRVPAPLAPAIDPRDGRLHPPAGVTATTVGHNGHRHDGPTDCGECTVMLRSEGWLTPAQHKAAREAEVDAELRRREKARILGIDLPL